MNLIGLVITTITNNFYNKETYISKKYSTLKHSSKNIFPFTKGRLISHYYIVPTYLASDHILSTDTLICNIKENGGEEGKGDRGTRRIDLWTVLCLEAQFTSRAVIMKGRMCTIDTADNRHKIFFLKGKPHLS